jgi:hypothetical protein
MWAFGALTNRIRDGGGDEGASFPRSDVEDLANGAPYIPGEVTDARRAGKRVQYDIQAKTWTMSDGRVITGYEASGCDDESE